jgi:hypothetical protein
VYPTYIHVPVVKAEHAYTCVPLSSKPSWRMVETQQKFHFLRRRDHTEHEARMYEVDCGFYNIVVSEEQLKRYGINYANLQKADTKAMELERAERQRNADNIRRLDPPPPKSSKRKQSPPPSSPPSPPCSLESIIQAPERTRPLYRTRGVCISLTGWFRSFGDYWF